MVFNWNSVRFFTSADSWSIVPYLIADILIPSPDDFPKPPTPIPINEPSALALVVAGLLMSLALITSGYLIIRRKGSTLDRCIGVFVCIAAISMAAFFSYRAYCQQQKYQRDVRYKAWYEETILPQLEQREELNPGSNRSNP